LNFIKDILFSHDDHNYIDYKILKEFPALKDIDWIFMKPDGRLNLLPYQPDKTKDGKLLKK
jgi:hypothetical protein